MIIELSLVGCLFILSLSNILIYRNKPAIIKGLLGIFVSCLYPAFKFISLLNPYMWIYELAALVAIILISIFYMPKKVTKNVSEYDYFELEKSYNQMRTEKEKMRQRFLSTISLINEGIVFYEDNCKNVILSDHAHEIIGGKQSLAFEEHVESIVPQDREEYKMTIARAVRSSEMYEIKYRVKTELGHRWVFEKGVHIGVDGKRSIIASVESLDVEKFKPTQYIEIDSMGDDSKLLPVIKNMLESRKSFVYCVFELSNIPKINEKYSREVGTIMINDYIRTIKNFYQKDFKKFYRISGIRFAVIIEDERMIGEILRDSQNSNSEIFNTKLQIGDARELMKPNFAVIDVTGNSKLETLELYRFANKTLDETVESDTRCCTVYRE